MFAWLQIHLGKRGKGIWRDLNKIKKEIHKTMKIKHKHNIKTILYIYIYIYIYTFTHIHISTLIDIYTHIYTHIHCYLLEKKASQL